MSTQIPPHVRFQNDYTEALIEIAKTEERLKLQIAHAYYVKTLLDSAVADEKERSEESTSSGEFAGMTIADIALHILREEGKPMSAMDISQRAMDGGFDADNIERARSHFSAVISRDIRGPKPKFRQMGRGAIGLSEWPQLSLEVGQTGEPKLESPQRPPSKVQRNTLPPNEPFGEEQQFKEDDIPF